MEELGRGRFVRLVRNERGWEWAERVNVTGVVVVAACTPAGNVILVEQPRPPVGASVIEMPAGLAGDEDASEALAAAAGRELEEETGWRAGQISEVTAGPVSAGMSNEVLTFFVARDLEKVGAGGGVDGERITVHEVPLAEVPAFVAQKAREGVLTDPKVFAGLFFLQAGGG